MTSDLGPALGTAYGDQTVLRHVLALIEAEGVGDRQALEFGVGSGGTLATIAGTLPVTGWDSFEGLPESWRPGFDQGAFAQSKIPQIENATICVGLFSETLPHYDWPDVDIALMHVDCDLGSSTMTVLENAGHLLKPGAFIVFDEYFGYEGSEQHEQLAWESWSEANGVEYETIGHGREQVAFRIASVGPA